MTSDEILVPRQRFDRSTHRIAQTRHLLPQPVRSDAIRRTVMPDRHHPLSEHHSEPTVFREQLVAVSENTARRFEQRDPVLQRLW